MKETKTWILLLPSLLVITILFIGPLIFSFLLSLNFFSITSDRAVGLQAYSTILADPRFLSSLIFSLKIAIIATAVSIVIAVLVSMTLRRTFLGRRLALFVYQFNLPVPALVIAISVLFLFDQGGLVSSVMHALGLVNDPSSFPMLVFDQDGIGLIITYVLKFFPFIGIAILSLLLTTLDDYEQQAATLGANRLQRFWYVLLPMMMPSILFSSVLVFAYAFGSYEVPYLLGSSAPLALPVLAYQDFTNITMNMLPEAMAIANVITVVMVVLVVFAYLQLNRMNRTGVRGNGRN